MQAAGAGAVTRAAVHTYGIGELPRSAANPQTPGGSKKGVKRMRSARYSAVSINM